MQTLSKLALPTLSLAAIAGAVALWSPSAPAVLNADNGFKIDPVHTSAIFGVKHNSVSNFYGRFNKADGSFNIDPADPSKSFIDITIATDSVDTANGGRDKHLKGGDFFAVTEFPTMGFKSKSFKKTGDGTYDVTGDFTMRGKTTEITVPLTDTGRGKGMRGGEVAGFETKFTVNRTNYGVSYGSGTGALGDDVTVIFSAEGAKGS